jgi:hypothetical protein
MNAILEPSNFNNTKFWLSCIKLPDKVIEGIHFSAQALGFNNIQTIKGSLNEINFTTLNALAYQLAQHTPDHLQLIYQNIRHCSLNDSAKEAVDIAFCSYLNKNSTAFISCIPCHINYFYIFLVKNHHLNGKTTILY